MDRVHYKMAKVVCKALEKGEVTSLESPEKEEIKEFLMSNPKGLISTYTGVDAHVDLYRMRRSLGLKYMRHLKETLGKIERYRIIFSKEQNGVTLVRGESTFSEMKRMKREGDILVPYPKEETVCPIDFGYPKNEEWIEKTLSYGSMSYLYGDPITPMSEEQARLLQIMQIYSKLYADVFSEALEHTKQKVLK